MTRTVRFFAAGLGLVLSAVLWLTPWATPSGVALADDPASGGAGKPALVVSVASVDQLMKDVNFLATAGGTPDLGVMVNIMSAPYTNGLDRSRPAGALGLIEGEELKIIGFLPIKNLKTFLRNFEEQVGPPAPLDDDGAPGVLRIGREEPYVFVKEQGGWAFLAPDTQSLASPPMDPVALLGGLNAKYDLAARVHVANVPEYMRKAAMSQLMAGYEAGLEEARLRGLDAGDLDPMAKEELAKQALSSLNDFLEGADQVTIGWGVDREAKNTHLELSVTAIAGSKLAGQLESVKNAATGYAGFQLADAAFTANVVASVRQEDMAGHKASIAVLRKETLKAIDEDADLPNDEARATAKDLAGKLIDAFQHTVESGKIDGGAAVILKPDALTFVGGGHVASGMEVEAIFKKAVNAAEKDPKFPGVAYDALKHAGVRIHTLSMPIPAEEEEAIQLLGPTLEAAVGVGETSFYAAVGRNAVATMTKVIDDSAAGGRTEIPPMKLQVAIGPLLDFLAVVDGRPEVTALMTVLERAPEKDHVLITSEPIERGAMYRIVVEEGILQVLGQAAKMRGGAPGGF